jgi:hypothetical protein
MRRREFMKVTLGTGAVLAAAPSLLGAMGAPLKITVYKSPSCGCCKDWVTYMHGQGFETDVKEMNDLTGIKRSFGVPAKLESCHTAFIGGYVIEGHVPADLVKKILAEGPKIVGLSAPGMPADAPGMGTGKTPYDVIAWDKAGKTSIFASR